MGPSITGLTRLLMMPYGCGEQNMITFVPNIFVINYLKATFNLRPEDLSNGRNYMTIGTLYINLNPFPDDKNLTLSKSKASADDKINVT